MLLKLTDLEKTIGTKELFADLSLTVNEGEKIAFIGRNGLGKTTLFNILTKQDKDFSGSLEEKKSLRMIMTKQEHNLKEAKVTAIDYILDELYLFRDLQSKININPQELENNIEEIQKYSDAVTLFSEYNYYDIEDRIINTLEDFGVTLEKAFSELKTLSGGEKRFVELVRVMYSKSDISLIDEPTNHMDYLGKEKFIFWLNRESIVGDNSVIVITHDRDVLKYVDRIIELKDKKIFSFSGNYDAYLKQNSIKTLSGINQYEINVRRLEKLDRQIREIDRIRGYSKSLKIVRDRMEKEYTEIKSTTEKPSFWLDKESKNEISDKVKDKYEKYKEKNISINNNTKEEYKKELLKVRDLSVGYDKPLFKNVNFTLNHGDRVMIKGKNGAGKSTLVKTLLNNFDNKKFSFKSNIYSGEIKFNTSVRVGVYEQEIHESFLDQKLSDAIYKIYFDLNQDINEVKIRSILSQYLFDPIVDWNHKINTLSGGQKARFQIIKMLVNKPNLLILDEPTNHLDLPSIEELENAFLNYNGAILYITHDTYLMDILGGEVIII